MDVMQLTTNRIEQVRSDAFDQAKKTADGVAIAQQRHYL
jgi:hypothetical protein